MSFLHQSYELVRVLFDSVDRYYGKIFKCMLVNMSITRVMTIIHLCAQWIHVCKLFFIHAMRASVSLLVAFMIEQA